MDERLLRIGEEMERCLRQKERLIVSIDGSCTAGKTTLAGLLADRYDCNVFHMDDFFLRPEQRTPERYNEAGGNVDYERFLEEVLTPLKAGRCFSYRPFDCKTFTLADAVTVTPKKLNIVEGSYSQHPYFGDPYDLKIFLTVDSEVQRQRIMARPKPLHSRFFAEWIPMEQRYFEVFDIRGKCDILF